MAPRERTTRARVLLVEDEELLRWSIERYLSRHACLVESAREGDAAMRMLAAATYDIVITDLAIDGPDGLTIAAEARRLHAETQVIVITGHGSKDTVLTALRQGVADFLEKPFDLELLLLTVERALEKTEILRELVQLSRTDGLTGLYNQRHCYAVLEAEIGRARRQGHPLALLLVDVDDFKHYNDQYGHLAGDAALTRVAAALRKACRREVDSAFRYGGDEFVVLLPEADGVVAAGVASRLKALVCEEGLSLSVSVGLACLRDGVDLQGLIREADQAMYRDKARASADGLRRAV